MKRKTTLRQRLLSMLLAAVCVVGLVPANLHVASASAPDHVTYSKEDTSFGTRYQSSNLGNVLLRVFNVNANGESVPGWCLEHKKPLLKCDDGYNLKGAYPSNKVSTPFLDIYMASIRRNKEIEAYFKTTDSDQIKRLLQEGKGEPMGWGGPTPQFWYQSPWELFIINAATQGAVWLYEGKVLSDSSSKDEIVAAVGQERYLALTKYGTKTSLEECVKLVREMYEGWEKGTYPKNTYYRYAPASNGSQVQDILVAEPNNPPPQDVEWSLTIKKVDATNPAKPLAGAKFRVKAMDGAFDEIVITNEAGIVRLDQDYSSLNGTPFAEGKYSIQEVEAPKGYKIVDSSVKYATVSRAAQNQTVEFTFYNEPEKGDGALRKVDKDNPDMGIAGAVFHIEGINNNFTADVTTAAGGYVPKEQLDFEKLPTGSYRVTETHAPEGYLPTDEVKTFDWPLQNGGDINLVFANDAKVKIRLLKVNENDKPLEGAIFQIWKDGQIIATEQTKADGTITLSNVTKGFYKFVEVHSPKGYSLAEPVEAFVDPAEIQGSKTIELTAKNFKLPSLTIMKRDKETKAPIPETSFHIEGISVSYQTDVKTGKDGTVTLTDLPVGAYKVTETSVPAPWILDSNNTESVFLDSRDGSDKPVELIFDNSKEPGLRIIKKDALSQKPVAGVTFRIEQIDGAYDEYKTTDENGEIFLPRITPGAYKVTETAVPGNYLLDDTPKTVTLVPNKTATLEFFNLQRPGLLIQKVDRDGGPIQGIEFDVSKKGGESLGTFLTNERGEIFIPNLEKGYYIVTETKTIDGFILDPTPHEVYLEAGKDGNNQPAYTLRLTNKRTPELTIYKVDSVVGGPVEGAKFQIWYAGTGSAAGSLENLGIFFSDKEGKIELGKTADGVGRLKEGWYKVKEIEAPDGYQIKEPAEQSIYLKGDDVKELTFKNTPLSAIIVLKKDSVNGNPVQGATFQLRYLGGTSGTEGTVIGQKTTSVNGTAIWTRLKAGTYIVEEVSAPDGYNIVTAMQTVYISGKDQDVITVEFDNQPDGNLLIKKVCSVNPSVTLANAQFKVTYADGTLIGNDNGLYTTNANGEILISNLEPGKSVVVTEVRAPEGFIIDTQPQTIVIKAGQTVSLTFQNQPKGELLIEKRDSVTNQVLPGAEFRVTTAAGCEVGLNGVIGDTTLTQNGIFTTDAEGHIRITGLVPGAYVITEIKAPDGYVIDSPMTNVVIGTKGDTQTVIIKNTPKGSLVIEKRDSVTKEPLAGAEFKVTTSAGTVVDNAGGAVSSNGIYTTDASGKIIITGLMPDTYVVQETKAPNGYHMDAPSQTVKVNRGDTQTLTFYDTPENTLNIVKKDSATGKNLAGATFYITDSKGAVADTAGGAVGSNGYYTTDETGMITLTGLKTGTYVVRETKAPNGYILDSEPQTIAVNGGGTYTLTFYNKPEGSLIIEKRDKLSNEPLYGAVFKVTTSSGEFVAQGGGTTSSNGRYTTDRNGQIHIYGLQPGTYVVTEETAPKGYLLDAPAQTVRVNANDTQTLTFYDTPVGGLIITKVDSESGKRLEGAQMEVRKMNGELVGTYYTDQKGNIQLPGLDSGWYVVVELKAPKGYLLDSTPQQIEVKDGSTATLEFKNTASASMLIHKIDAQTKKGIPGVKFMVYDSSMTPIGEYESDHQGYVHLNKSLSDGKYYVREIVAAPGYILDNAVKSFYVTAGDTAMIEWENTAEYGQIQVIKTSAAYSSTNGLPAGTPLAGAVFTIYDKRNNVVDTIETNASGIASSKLLPLGLYTVKETKAPVNYGLNTNAFTADLEFAGQVVKIAVADNPVTTGVTIKKTGYQQVMNGQPVRYTVSNVANTSSVPLESFYWRDTIPTDAMRLTRLVTGTYSATQNYKVTYTTNLHSEWRTAYDNLSTAQNYTLDMSAKALGLASNEYVTSFMLSFGVVPAGFHQLTSATVDGQVLSTLTNGYQFTNKADVGGLYGQYWQQSIARWTTSVYSNYVPVPPTTPTLPRTGY